jgi:hypothetical protein
MLATCFGTLACRRVEVQRRGGSNPESGYSRLERFVVMIVEFIVSVDVTLRMADCIYID